MTRCCLRCGRENPRGGLVFARRFLPGFREWRCRDPHACAVAMERNGQLNLVKGAA